MRLAHSTLSTFHSQFFRPGGGLIAGSARRCERSFVAHRDIAVRRLPAHRLKSSCCPTPQIIPNRRAEFQARPSVLPPEGRTFSPEQTLHPSHATVHPPLTQALPLPLRNLALWIATFWGETPFWLHFFCWLFHVFCNLSHFKPFCTG